MNKQKGNVTPCTKGFYPWVPANCQEVDGEFYFNIVWEDCEGGWKGRAMTGERLFHPADMNKTAVIVPKGG